MTEQEIKEGYYWIKFNNEIQVAYYEKKSNRWYVCGHEIGFTYDSIDYVIGYIERPE